MLLSIVMPVYNEKDTLFEIIRRVLDAPVTFEREIVLVDDCSKDGTLELYPQLSSKFPNANIRLVKHPVNMGKGAALRTGFAEARGDIVIVQDSDLEYDPQDYPSCSSRSSMVAPTWSMGHASSAARSTACCTSGTMSATSS